MSILLLELIEDCRNRLDDLGGDTGTVPTGYYKYWQADDASCLWRNKELIRYLKIVLLDIAGRAPWTSEGARGDSLGTPTRLSVKVGNPEVVWNPAVLAAEQIRLVSTGQYLQKVTSSQLYDLFDEDWGTVEGTPVYYVEVRRGLIRLVPIPIVADELRLVVKRRNLDEFEWEDISHEATPSFELEDVPDDLLEALIVGVCRQAYLKHDADTLNIDLSREYERQFAVLVGPPVSWRQKEARRENANLAYTITPFQYTRTRYDTTED